MSKEKEMVSLVPVSNEKVQEYINEKGKNGYIILSRTRFQDETTYDAMMNSFAHYVESLPFPHLIVYVPHVCKDVECYDPVFMIFYGEQKDDRSLQSFGLSMVREHDFNYDFVNGEHSTALKYADAESELLVRSDDDILK